MLLNQIILLCGAVYAANALTAFDELDVALKTYDKRVRPGQEHALNVSVSAYVISLETIELDRREVILTLYFRQLWTDERLKLSQGVKLRDVSDIWHPDTFFVNEKNLLSSNEHQFVRILPKDNGGEILWSQKLTKRFNVHRDSDFVYHTKILAESYGNTRDDIFYSINNGENQAFQFSEDCFRSESSKSSNHGMQIIGIEPEIIEVEVGKNKYSSLSFNVKFQNLC